MNKTYSYSWKWGELIRMGYWARTAEHIDHGLLIKPIYLGLCGPIHYLDSSITPHLEK